MKRPCMHIKPNGKPCGIPSPGNRCAEHQAIVDAADNARRNEIAREHGLHTVAWRGANGIRMQRLKHDHFKCTFELPGCTGKATTVHLDPELGGDHARATLETTRSACASCHGVVDAPRASGRPAGASRQGTPTKPAAVNADRGAESEILVG